MKNMLFSILSLSILIPHFAHADDFFKAANQLKTNSQIVLDCDQTGRFSCDGELALINELGYSRSFFDEHADCEYGPTPRNRMAATIDGQLIEAEVYEASCSLTSYHPYRSAGNSWSEAMETCIQSAGQCVALWRNKSGKIYMMRSMTYTDYIQELQRQRGEYIESLKEIVEQNQRSTDAVISR